MIIKKKTQSLICHESVKTEFKLQDIYCNDTKPCEECICSDEKMNSECNS